MKGVYEIWVGYNKVNSINPICPSLELCPAIKDNYDFWAGYQPHMIFGQETLSTEGVIHMVLKGDNQRLVNAYSTPAQYNFCQFGCPSLLPSK